MAKTKLPKRKRGGQNRQIKVLYQFHELMDNITEETVRSLPKLHERLHQIALGEIKDAPISSQVTCIKALIELAEKKAKEIEEEEFGEEEQEKGKVETSREEGSNVIKMEM